MMTLKDWRFVFRMAEFVAKEAYALGKADQKTGKSRSDKYFQINGPMELVFKKKYAEFNGEA